MAHLSEMNASDIAPCGVNCFVCSARLDNKNTCPGCRVALEAITRKSCKNCAIRICVQEKGVEWCFECDRFPCTRIKDLSKRYLKNYRIDLIDNGRRTKEDLPAFLLEQQKRFTCPYCGGIIDQHNRRCSICASEALY